MKNLNPEERLMIGADFDPMTHGGISGVHKKVLELADTLADTGVYIKLNFILRAVGYSLIDEIHDRGLKVFADLKLNDIPNTLKNDAVVLAEHAPEMVTVMASTGRISMQQLKNALNEQTEVLGVTVLTSFDEEASQTIFNDPVETAVTKLTKEAVAGGIDGIVCSPNEVPLVRSLISETMTINTPGIRPSAYNATNDDQARTMTPERALQSGVDRLIIARPVIKAEDPRLATLAILEEIRTIAGNDK